MIKKGAIFDFNGTLLWDTHLQNLAWDYFFSLHDIQLTDEEKHQRIQGKQNRDIMMDLFDNNLTEEEIYRYTLEKEYEYQRLCLELDDYSLAEGTIELFEKLKEQNVPFVIATSSGIENVEFYIRTLNLSKWFRNEDIIYDDGSVRGKPSPDLFLKALKVMGIEGKDSVIFEDSIAGVKAAEAAGAGRIVIVNSNNGDYTEFHDKYPIIKSFYDVDLDWFE